MLKNLKPKAAEAKRLADERRREIEKLPWSQIESYANVLMAGYVEDLGDGRRVAKYIDDDPGGEVWTLKERDARIAMAILLRSGLPLTQDLRNCLAELFDPDEGTHPAIARKLIFKPRKRRKGEAHDPIRDTAVAMYVHNLIRQGERVEIAQKKAADHFGKSFHTIRDICGHAKTRKGLLKLIEQANRHLPVVK